MKWYQKRYQGLHFFVEKYNHITKKYYPQKWTEIENIDITTINDKDQIHRYTEANEFILDFDEDDFDVNQGRYYIVLNQLILNKFTFKSYFSGGKGYHIHVILPMYWNLFDKNINKKVKELLLEYLQIPINWVDINYINSVQRMIRFPHSYHRKGKNKILLHDNYTPLLTPQFIDFIDKELIKLNRLLISRNSLAAKIKKKKYKKFAKSIRPKIKTLIKISIS